MGGGFIVQYVIVGIFVLLLYAGGDLATAIAIAIVLCLIFGATGGR